MKKLIVMGLTALMVLSVSALSHAETAAEAVARSKMHIIDVTLEVPEVFGFHMWENLGTQTLRPLSEDIDERFGQIELYVTTNRGHNWSLQAVSPDGGCLLQGLSEPEVLPLILTTFNIPDDPNATPEPNINNAKGTHFRDVELTSLPTDIYIAVPGTPSDAGEMFVDGLKVHGLFLAKENDILLLDGSTVNMLHMPQGTYKGPIVITLVDLGP